MLKMLSPVIAHYKISVRHPSSLYEALLTLSLQSSGGSEGISVVSIEIPFKQANTQFCLQPVAYPNISLLL